MTNMKKKFGYLLMAVLTVVLSLAVTSCKDDDKNDNNSNGNMEQAASTGGDMTMAEIQRSSLISNFSALQADELLAQPDWKSKTYEADFGLVLNESRPTVRTIEVGTIEAADEEACALLDVLGIDYQSPAGFTFADSEVGTVSYQHGGGADANTLAVINLDVKGLTGITQLQMVRELPANADEEPYYHVGDIIKEPGDDRLWLCVRAATSIGDHAYFISFDTDHPTGTCKWGKYNDVVYAAKKPMASYMALANWMSNFLMHDQNYKALQQRLQDKHVEDRVNDLIPASEAARKEFIEGLEMSARTTKDREPLEGTNAEHYKWKDIDNTTNGMILAPHGRLLCDKFRYSIGLTYDYWVPTVSWVSDDNCNSLVNAIIQEPGQTEGKHFKYDVSESVYSNTDYVTAQYHFVKTAIHWQHKYFTIKDKSYWAVFDFTQDWSNHPKYSASWSDDSCKWARRNITSSELLITDRGHATNYFEVSMYRDYIPANEKAISADEAKLYSIIGEDGQFYDNVEAAKAAETEAVAIVTYLGGDYRVETGSKWNGLAIALTPSKDDIAYIDEAHSHLPKCALSFWAPKEIHKDLTGLASTETLLGDCGNGHQHPAAKYCRDSKKEYSFYHRKAEFSNWFLPSYGQWVLAMKGLGYKYSFDATENSPLFVASGDVETTNTALQTALNNAGVPDLYKVLKNNANYDDEAQFWTTTNYDEGEQQTYQTNRYKAYVFQNRSSVAGSNFWLCEKYKRMYVLPFIAFRYDNGGKAEMEFE